MQGTLPVNKKVKKLQKLEQMKRITILL